jgi:putative transposase
MDSVADQLADGSRLRSLTVVDIYTWECLAIDSEQRLKGEDVVLTLNRIKIQRGVPKFLYCDNGSEFSSQAMDLWAYQNGVRMAFSRPGKRTDNAHVESFNGTFRAGCLDAHWFTSLTEAWQIVETHHAPYDFLPVRTHRGTSFLGRMWDKRGSRLKKGHAATIGAQIRTPPGGSKA